MECTRRYESYRKEPRHKDGKEKEKEKWRYGEGWEISDGFKSRPRADEGEEETREITGSSLIKRSH